MNSEQLAFEKWKRKIEHRQQLMEEQITKLFILVVELQDKPVATYPDSHREDFE